jgi:hypothetical protein
MKKYFGGLVALILAIAASAFTAPQQTSSKFDPMYHWFAPNGTYLGFRTQAAQQDLCGDGLNICASGYSEINENETPVLESYFDDVEKE